MYIANLYSWSNSDVSHGDLCGEDPPMSKDISVMGRLASDQSKPMLSFIMFTVNFRLNPLSPHDAIKHHFTSLKTDLIFQQLRVLERDFHETGLPIHGNFL